MHGTHAPVDDGTAPRDRTRSALVPAVAVAVAIATALVAATFPAAVGLATLGLGGTAVAATAA